MQCQGTADTVSKIGKILGSHWVLSGQWELSHDCSCLFIVIFLYILPLALITQCSRRFRVDALRFLILWWRCSIQLLYARDETLLWQKESQTAKPPAPLAKLSICGLHQERASFLQKKKKRKKNNFCHWDNSGPDDSFYLNKIAPLNCRPYNEREGVRTKHIVRQS